MSFGLAAAPTEPVEVPGAVARLAAGRPLAAVWQNQMGGITWSAGDRHIKWNPHTTGIDLDAEVQRLRWASGRIACPVVVDAGADDDGQWLVTETIDARTAIAATGDEVGAAVDAIALGLRQLHGDVPVHDCPFDWSMVRRRDAALGRLERGDVDPGRLHPQHHHLSPAEMAEQLRVLPEPNDVVCHGDACAPNTLIDADGRFAGLVDLGALGVGHRWSDLAVAAWSLEWNFGPGWIDRFLDTYGITHDDEQLAWHQLLWDLG